MRSVIGSGQTGAMVLALPDFAQPLGFTMPADISDANKLALLEDIRFGSQTAEDEADALEHYFVQTDQWKRMYRGEIDVVYGMKGSGKSAIFTLIERHADKLFSDNIVTASAENPRGATVFRNIVSDPCK
jgi:hypothetical protein